MTAPIGGIRDWVVYKMSNLFFPYWLSHKVISIVMKVESILRKKLAIVRDYKRISINFCLYVVDLDIFGNFCKNLSQSCWILFHTNQIISEKNIITHPKLNLISYILIKHNLKRPRKKTVQTEIICQLTRSIVHMILINQFFQGLHLKCT